MIRLLVFALGGLILGGIIHGVTVLGVPHYAEADAWARLRTFGPGFAFNVVPRPAPDKVTIPLLDPAMIEATCEFTLNDAPVRIAASPPDTFWSLALFDRQGVNLYSMNDHGTGAKPIDLLVATVDQVAQIRENPPEDFGELLIVDWKSKKGFAVLRIFAPTPLDETEAKSAISGAQCRTRPIQP